MFNQEKISFQKMQRKRTWIYNENKSIKGNMKIKFCPRCESTELVMVAGATVGMWECKKCNYQSSIFPEKEIKLKNEKKK